MSRSSVLVVFCVLLSCGAARYDFFAFVTRWTGTACLSTRANEPPPLHDVPKNVAAFSIHGAWPTNYDGTWPSFCNNSYPFKWNEIQDLKSLLDVQWPSMTGPNPDFYKHEWEKHGTCSLDVLPNEHSYFSASAKTNSNTGFAACLSRAGIKPSQTQPVSLTTLSNTLSNCVGKKVAVGCLSVRGQLHFNQVTLCLDRNFKAINCPSTTMSTAAKSCSSSSQALVVPIPQSCYNSAEGTIPISA